MFRRHAIRTTALAAALAVAAAPSTASADAREPTPHPDGPFPFGTVATLEYPYGAYPHEYDWDDLRPVDFNITDVHRPEPDTVHYTLTVDVPELGRVYGMGNATTQCAVAGNPTGDPEPLPGPVELEEGTYSYSLSCEIPDLFVGVEIRFVRADAHGEDILFLYHGSLEDDELEAEPADGAEAA